MDVEIDPLESEVLSVAGESESDDQPEPADREDDRSLLAELRGGNDDAFAELVEAKTPAMLAVARRFMRNEDDARDAVQDAFLSAFKGLERFAGDSLLSTWLYRITVNACLMKLRRRRRKPEQSIEDLLPGFLENGMPAEMPRPWRESAHALLERAQNRATVRAAIDLLPENYRTVLMLRDIEDFDTDEAAEALDLSVAATKTRLHRARLALKGLLDKSFIANDGSAALSLDPKLRGAQ